MTAYDIATNSASNIADNQADLNGEVTALDKSLLDAVCVFFEYGTNSDLSNSTRTSIDEDRGIFADGGDTYTINITGLPAETTYYYKAKGRMIRYGDDPSVDYIVDKSNFIYEMGSIQTEAEKAFNYSYMANTLMDSATAMQELANSIIGISELLLSDFISDLWSSVTKSENFLDQGTAGNLDGSSSWSYWEIDLDLSNADTLKVYVNTSNTGGAAEIKIDGTVLKTVGSNTSWQEYILDVSGYTDTHTFTFSFDNNENTAEVNYVTGHDGAGSALQLKMSAYDNSAEMDTIDLD